MASLLMWHFNHASIKLFDRRAVFGYIICGGMRFTVQSISMWAPDGVPSMLQGSYCLIGDVKSTVDKRYDESEIGLAVGSQGNEGLAVGSQGNENVKRHEIRHEIDWRGHRRWTAYVVG